MKRTIITLSLAAVCVASVARADEAVEKRSFEIQPSRHELSVDLGYQAGYGGAYGNASGMKLTGDYAYKFHPIAWFDLQVGNVFGFGGKDGRCAGSFDSNCYRGGWDMSLAAGVRRAGGQRERDQGNGQRERVRAAVWGHVAPPREIRTL